MRSIILVSFAIVCIVSFFAALQRKATREECEQNMPWATREECRMLSQYTGGQRDDIVACSREPGWSVTTCYMLVKYGRGQK